MSGRGLATITIVVAVAGILFICAGIYLQYMRMAVPSPDDDTGAYYRELLAMCRSDACCEASVGAMWEGGYRLAARGECPEGFAPNTMLCAESYNWCEPAAIPDESP